MYNVDTLTIVERTKSPEIRQKRINCILRWLQSQQFFFTEIQILQVRLQNV